MSANSIAADDPRREVGLIYEDDGLRQGPACHVLAIGVAAYQSKIFSQPLTTAAISARAFIDWFADPAKARFTNPHCRLGSAAIVLSETADTELATYAEGPVPRATFAKTQAAVWAWVERINCHKDNLAVLYFAGHGESFLTRTSILVEDYDTKPMDVTFGISEIEQFVSSLENATPVSQLLLFDCCRNPTSLGLPWNEPFGNKLIALKRDRDDHGEPRKQWTICGTSLGEYGSGLKDGPTLFNMALIESLNGVASDHTAEDWPVRPGLLVDRIDKLLAMHRLPDEKAQTPAGRLAGSFDITFCGEPRDVPVYISLKDPVDWPDSEIEFAVDGAAQTPILGLAAESPFELLRLAEGASIELNAHRAEDNLGTTRAKIRAPVTFVEIARQAAPTPVTSSAIPPGRNLTNAPRIAVDISSSVPVKKGALVTIARNEKGNSFAWEQLSDLGGTTFIELPLGQSLEPGEYVVTLRTPDGGIQTVDTQIEMGEEQTIGFATPTSPHSWMKFPVLTGSIQPIWSEPDHDALRDTGDGIEARPLGGLTAFLDVVDDFPDSTSLADGAVDPRYTQIRIADKFGRRFSRGMLARPIFFELSRNDPARLEIAVAPLIGFDTAKEHSPWVPSFIVDRKATASRRMVTVAVEAPRWAGLLGFLEARDAANGAKLLDERLHSLAISAIHDKVNNPFAAIAGALIAVGAAVPDLKTQWDPWLFNIANWFPGLPDGPIVLARRLLTKARSESELNEAKSWFVEGFRRGVPVFSLSVEWLARGLESLPDEDGELLRLRETARALANRVDSVHAFTVIRVNI
ncbi:caspase family protein [Rhizobium sp. CF080]|uniref:caspase family protein n=1 Tax=Rhizobium sp. (strain CF080) TaxID=1144310 RepID=UPI0003040AE4|nr:caspase family protein [Rhizobium sp. CF080]